MLMCRLNTSQYGFSKEVVLLYSPAKSRDVLPLVQLSRPAAIYFCYTSRHILGSPSCRLSSVPPIHRPHPCDRPLSAFTQISTSLKHPSKQFLLANSSDLLYNPLSKEDSLHWSNKYSILSKCTNDTTAIIMKNCPYTEVH